MKFIFIAFISLLFIAQMSKDINFSKPHIAVIEVNGLIASESQSSAENIIPLLKRASENVNTSVIIIKVNRGGGSATQSKIIHDEIIKIKG